MRNVYEYKRVEDVKLPMSNWVTICDPLISSNKIKLANYMLLNNDRKQVPVSANTWFKNESTYVCDRK